MEESQREWKKQKKGNEEKQSTISPELVKISRLHHGKEKEQSVDTQYRRLDAIARLFQVGGDCAAVYYDEESKRIIVTHNEVRVLKRNKTPDSAVSRLLIKTMEFFMQHDFTNTDESLSTLKEICSTSLFNALARGRSAQEIVNYENFIKNYYSAETNGIISAVIKNIYQSKASDWLNEDSLDRFARLLTDDERLGWQDKKTPKVSISQLSVIRNNLIYIQRLYQDCWHLVRDFKKSMSFFKDNDINAIELVMIGNENEHAEMRMMGYLLLNNKLTASKTQYVGISKLCCQDCSHAIAAINGKGSNATRVDRVEVSSSDDEYKAAEQVTVEVRGDHGLSFKGWTQPSYLSKNPPKNMDYSHGAKSYIVLHLEQSKKQEALDNWANIEFPALIEKTKTLWQNIVKDYTPLNQPEKKKENVRMAAFPSDSSEKSGSEKSEEGTSQEETAGKTVEDFLALEEEESAESEGSVESGKSSPLI
jgi:hypothetical protein